MAAGVRGYQLNLGGVGRIMRRANIGPYRLAGLVGVTPKRMQALLHGKTTLPTELLHPLASALGVPPDALLIGTQAEQDKDHDRANLERAARAKVRRSGAKCPRCGGCGRLALEALTEDERAALDAAK